MGVLTEMVKEAKAHGEHPVGGAVLGSLTGAAAGGGLGALSHALLDLPSSRGRYILLPLFGAGLGSLVGGGLGAHIGYGNAKSAKEQNIRDRAATGAILGNLVAGPVIGPGVGAAIGRRMED
jgi:uncharacterized membrane protein YebE (DUF533 family)